MTLRTIADLSTFLRSDLAWRRKENSVFHSIVRTSEAAKKQALLRGAVAVLYAHWEGFVKTSCRAYLEYVRIRRLNHSELAAPFLCLAARRRLGNLDPTSKRLDNYVDLCEWFLEEWDRKAWLPNADAVISTSNLNSDILKSMFRGLGLNYHSDFQIAEKPIIDSLVDLRNHLAHGEWRTVGYPEYEQYYSEIGKLMEQVCAQVETAAATNAYRRAETTPS